MTTTNAENEQVVRDYHQRVLTEKELNAVAELFAADYIEHNPGLPDSEIRGREQMVDFWQDLFDAFPDLSVTEEFTVAEGNQVVARTVQSGTHRGEFMGIELTENQFEINGIAIYQIEDGTIAENWVTLDRLGLLQQLGVVEPLGE